MVSLYHWATKYEDLVMMTLLQWRKGSGARGLGDCKAVLWCRAAGKSERENLEAD